MGCKRAKTWGTRPESAISHDLLPALAAPYLGRPQQQQRPQVTPRGEKATKFQSRIRDLRSERRTTMASLRHKVAMLLYRRVLGARRSKLFTCGSRFGRDPDLDLIPEDQWVARSSAQWI